MKNVGVLPVMQPAAQCHVPSNAQRLSAMLLAHARSSGQNERRYTNVGHRTAKETCFAGSPSYYFILFQ
jgi:hypothetical protein